MIILPAIDLYEGKAVRLYKGDYAQMTVYSDDPTALARKFAEAGAAQMHMVDLEGAKNGTTPNLELVERCVRESGLLVEVGGGIRDMQTVERYLARRRATGSLAPDEQRHGPQPRTRQRLHAWLPERLQGAADATLAEHVAAFVAAGGQPVSLASMSRAIATLPADDPAQAVTPRGRRRRPGRPLKSKA